jgi:hypothetical protein
MYYGQECMEDYEYEQQLHEIEAREQEQILYSEYISQKKSVPISKLVWFFTNHPIKAV